MRCLTIRQELVKLYVFRGGVNGETLTKVTIPDEVTSPYDGITYAVTVVGDPAMRYGIFYGCSALKEVSIGNNVTTIVKAAFEHCYSLTEVSFGDNLKTIGGFAFLGCGNLKEIKIPNSVTHIGDHAFMGCSIKEKIEVPQTIEYLGSWRNMDGTPGPGFIINIKDLPSYLASVLGGDDRTVDYLFQGSPITQLIIPMGTKKIKANAFNGCTTIESVVIPEGLEEIGDSAFYNCKNLYGIDLPQSLTYLGADAFNGCIALYEVNLPSALTKIGDNAYANCHDLEIVNFSTGLTTIGNGAFAGCDRLKEALFPEGLTTIGNNAFDGCSNLTKAPFPKSLETIGNRAFSGTHLKDVKFGDNLRSIGDNAFSTFQLFDPNDLDSEENTVTKIEMGWQEPTVTGTGATSFTNLKLPQSLESLGAYAFAGCEIKTIELPSNIKNIGFGCFYGNHFTEVKIPASMTKISEGMFLGCTNLKKVEFHDNISSIERYAFALTGIRTMEIPNPVSSIAKRAFWRSDIINVSFPESLTSIGEYAFKGTAMVSFEIPNSVKEIGQNALGSLHYLKMGTGFNGFSTTFCEGTDVLEMVSMTPPQLPADRLGFTPKMVLVPEGAGDAYLANSRWKDYNIVARNAKKADIYIKESGTLATEIRLQSGIMPGAVTNLVLHGEALNENDFAIIRSNMPACYEIDMSDVANTSIPSGVFDGKAGLLSVTLPKGVKRIEDYAFANCHTATFNIPSTVEYIGSGAFENCESMNNELVFENTLKSIGGNAFYGCRSLKSIDLSAFDDVTLSEEVFSGCYALNKVVLPKNVTTIPGRAFSNTDIARVEIPATATIGWGAFSECHNLKEVVFENGFNGLGENAFLDCTGLTTISFPESVTKINNETFSGCSALQSIELPNTLTSLGYGSFYRSGLNSITIPASIKRIPENCFAESEIVYADIEGATQIAQNAFANCPNLLVLNLPTTLESVDLNSLNSPSLSAINSPSLNPAATTANPFANVNNVTCALSIPRPSFGQYLSAEYWGKFVSIRNCIDTYINVEDNEGNAVEDDSENPVCELTYMDEGDYQEMLEDMEDEEENGNDVPQSRRRAMRIMRANGVAAINRGYGKLFNNASLFLDDDSETRFFLGLSPKMKNYTVTYNGQDITSEVDPNTMSFVIKGLKSMGNLVITVSDSLTGIKNTYSDSTDGDDAPLYNLSGIRVTNPAPGIYIKGGKKVVIK